LASKSTEIPGHDVSDPCRREPMTALLVVIDDHEGVRHSLRALFESAGYEIEDFPSAVAYLAGGMKGDCIIADFRMPQMSGLELQQELLRRNAQVPLIVMTGHGDVALAVAALRAGALDFLEKPLDDEQLLDSVNVALAHGRKTRCSAQVSADAAELIATLTLREREVLDCLVLGLTNKLVAHRLGISPRTVETHRARVQLKLDARDLSKLVRLSIVAGNRGG